MNYCFMFMPEYWGTGPAYLYASRRRAEHIARLLNLRVHSTAEGLYWLGE